MAAKEFGIDLGTKQIKLCKKDEGIIYNEKNIVALTEAGSVIAYGDEAYEMYEKAPDSILITFPVSKGVIADYTNMRNYLDYIVALSSNAKKKRDFFIAVPTHITDVEKRSFLSLIDEAKLKSKRVFVVEKPIADACGAGIDVSENSSNLIVDIGADTTEVSIISSGGIVYSTLCKIGGNDLDISIAQIVKRKFNVIIGQKAAEYIKITLANATNSNHESINVMGRNIVTGLPKEVTVTSEHVYEAISEHMETILTVVKKTLERTPPEMSSDIKEHGIYLTGGSAKLSGLKDYLSKETMIKANVAKKPEDCVIKGLERIIEDSSLRSLAFAEIKSRYE
ncbi:MAG: rod shape-determining protein [Lachnospiraceae bacterium]|nr:rod shape-determining protein [Lachnospiraceae bacterium]